MLIEYERLMKEKKRKEKKSDQAKLFSAWLWVILATAAAS
jgi:hypothetical protein